MASSSPVFQGQSIALCQFCEVDPKIQWKCIDCDLLLCTKCKDKIHSKVKTAEEHEIINIKEIGKPSDQDADQSVQEDHIVSSGDLAGMDKKYPLLALSIQNTSGSVNTISLELSHVQEYTTNLPVHYIQVSAFDDSLWIGSSREKTLFSFRSSRHLQKIKLEQDDLRIISSYNVNVQDIAITPSNDLIVTDVTPKLKIILFNSDKVTESTYRVEPFNAWCTHVTRRNIVVIGSSSGEKGAVYLMDIKGVYKKIYKHENGNRHLFEWPWRLTSTSSGTICVIDIGNESLVMLEQEEIISIYIGHRNINNSKNIFRPRDVASTSNDNIIVTDPWNHTLHILNNRGNVLTYYNTREVGIHFPYSLAFNMAGQHSILYIGCVDGKLYKLTLSESSTI